MSSEIIKWPSGETNLIFGKFSDIKLENPVFIIDENVFKLNQELFQDFKQIILIDPHESKKSLETIHNIYRTFLEFGVDKNSVIVGVGGGITCDIAGFVSATFYRGTRLVLVPTSLLAMADAGIGGKNGVNYGDHKNIIGTIRQPEKIIIDVNFLKTLPSDEIRNGMAEVIKQAIIHSEELFSEIEKPELSVKIQQGIFPEDLLKKIIKVKTDIVLEDELENNRRRVLNFGHTLGHIIELKQGVKHGDAVAIGMMMALKFSVHKGKCKIQTQERVSTLLAEFGLPSENPMDISEIVKSLEFDKKKAGKNIHFIFADDIGKVYSESLSIEVLTESLLEIFA